MKLSILIPCYNEEKRLPDTLKKIFDYFSKKKNRAEIIFVDDGSNDRTRHIILKTISRWKKSRYIAAQLISYQQNKGKGYAIKKGFLHTHGNLVLLCDADLSTPIEELEKFLPYIKNNDIVIGSRKHQDTVILKAQPIWRTIMGKVYSFLSKQILNLNVDDTTCGFKLFKKPIVKLLAHKMRINRWAYDSELLKIARIHNKKITEIGIRWHNQPNSKVRLIPDTLSSFVDLLRIVVFSLAGVYDK